MSTSRECGTLGSRDLRLPDELRGPLRAHLAQLRENYERRGWAGRVGFGQRPALVVIDMARFWVDPQQQIGSQLQPVLDGVCRVLRAARQAQIPIFFTTFAHDPHEPTSIWPM
jgi:maleamate amidohydrolase